MTITKSDYLKFKECSSFFWYWKNLKDVLSPEKEDPFIDRLKSQGYEVELFARQLYPNAVLVNGKPVAASQKTKELLDQGTKEIFQAGFLVDGLFASCDVLVWNELFQGWDLIEVKSSTDKDRKKKEHILDAAFQRIITQKAGLKVVNVYLVELNKEYYKDGEIDPNAIFNMTEITTECMELEAEILADIQEAKQLLTKAEPTECSCRYKGRSKHCRAFKHLYPNVPSYSVYDLRAIGRSTKKLEALVDAGTIKLQDIPDDFKLSKTHALQKRVFITKEEIFDKKTILDKFDLLKYPLYFLDYETLACGIPKFENTFPYQQTVFQYSLHILHKDGRMEHKEYIHQDQTTPVHIIPQKLREDIGDSGNVVVWNKTFEAKCNSDLALVNPDLAGFLIGINDRIFDLMKIFQSMEYLVDDFKGKYSIKNILPVMCPDLSYADLEVSNGAEAVVEYENLIFGNIAPDVKESKFDALLAYCKLDTWAMVRIFQELERMISDT